MCSWIGFFLCTTLCNSVLLVSLVLWNVKKNCSEHESESKRFPSCFFLRMCKRIARSDLKDFHFEDCFLLLMGICNISTPDLQYKSIIILFWILEIWRLISLNNIYYNYTCNLSTCQPSGWSMANNISHI